MTTCSVTPSGPLYETGNEPKLPKLTVLTLYIGRSEMLCMVPLMPWGIDCTLALMSSDYQPSWPPNPTAQRPLNSLRKPHREK